MKEFDPFRLDIVNECLWRGNERISLTPKAFALLAILVERPGTLLPQSELIEKLWPDTFVQPEVLKTHIRDLRSILGDDARNPRFIETQHRRGYRFIASVRDGKSSTRRQYASWRDFVGHEGDLKSLQNAFREACSGTPQLVFVTGEVGIGKSSLVDAFEHEVLDGPAETRLLRGQCVEGYGGHEAYYPALEAVSNLFRLSNRDEYIEILAEYGPTWLAQFPASLKKDQHKRLEDELAGATTERMLREFCVMAEVIAKDSPVVLILEDAHWADPHTVDLIAALARGRWVSRLMVIVTCRTVELTLANRPLKRLMDNLAAHHLCQELKVLGLKLPDIEALLEKKAPNGRVPIGLPEFLYRHSEGNPLFLEAALEQLTTNGFLAVEDHGWTVKAPLADIRTVVADTLRKLLGAHIESHVSEREQIVLEAASVCGVAFNVALAAAVSEASQEQVEDICEQLSRRGHFIRAAGALDLPDGTVTSKYEFVHSLYREVFYERIARVRKARLHKLAGMNLESTYAGQLELIASQAAFHFERCAEWKRVARHLFLVAELASRRFAVDDAVYALEHALKLMEKVPEPEIEPERVKALYRIAEVYMMVDEPAKAIDALETALRSPAISSDNRTKMQILMRMAFMLSRLSGSRCLAAAKGALDLGLTDDDPYIRAEARMGFFGWKVLCGAWNTADINECVAAVSELEHCPNPAIPAQGQILISIFHFLSSRYSEGLAAVRNGAAVLASAGDAVFRIAELYEVWLLLFSGQLGAALKKTEREIAAYRKHGNSFRESFWKAEMARILLEALDYKAVSGICRESNTILNKLGAVWTQCSGPVLQGTSEVHLGRLGDAKEHLSKVHAILDAEDTWLHWYWKLPLYRAQTELELRSGDLISAGHAAEKFLSAALITEERTWQALAFDACARVALAKNEPSAAREFITNGVDAMAGFDVPLAQWRVHKTATQVMHEETERHRALARKTIERLANSLRDFPSLRHSFLVSSEVQEVFKRAADVA